MNHCASRLPPRVTRRTVLTRQPRQELAREGSAETGEGDRNRVDCSVGWVGPVRGSQHARGRPLGYCRRVPDDPSLDAGSVRVAEVIAALSLATDLGIGVPLEHGLQSTLFAMRLADRLGVDSETASQTYYTCLLFYVGCTANADVAAELFGADDALTTTPRRSGSGRGRRWPPGFMRAIAPPGGSPLVRARQLAHGLPRVALVFKEHLASFCEVAEMLTDRLGVPRSVGALFGHVAERWDGKGQPGRAKRGQIPLPVRIVHVARDAAFQRMLGGDEFAARIIRERSGHAFDPAIATLLVDEAAEILALDASASAWDEMLACEPPTALDPRGRGDR